ncbi:MAG TPA: histidine phosphatase family protein [Variovorax sp.]|nr:histidine phosphatase family protein [Variovorax sp.]
MNATRLIVVRHGETAWNVDTRIQGQLDIDLNDTGRQQARQLASALADQSIDALYASDLARAWHTADAVARATGVAAVAEPRLRERAFGHFEGRTFAEIEAQSPEEARLWRTRDPDFAPPAGGESLLTFRERVTGVAAALAARHVGSLVVLVAHGGVMDVLYRAATGQTLQAPRTWHLGNAAINRLLWTPQGFSLVGWGDVSHLAQDARDESLIPRA